MKYNCTFTGIDESTDLIRLAELSKQYPFIEWGVLFSFSRMGKDPRYPSSEYIYHFIDWSNYNGTRIKRALHLCGSAANKFISIEKGDEITEKDELLFWFVRQFNRVQLNINALNNAYSIGFDIVKTVRRLSVPPIIIQYNENNKQLVKLIHSENPHSPINMEFKNSVPVLKDASGGNGILDNDYTIPEYCNNVNIGFAGGLNPDNIDTAFPKIYNSVMAANVEGQNDNNHFWIDMESGVRTDNKLDLDKVEQVAKYVDNFIKSQPTTLDF